MQRTTPNLELYLPNYGEQELTGEIGGVSLVEANLLALDEVINDTIEGNVDVVDYTASGAIAEKFGVDTLSGAGALAMTLADPITGTDDGKILRIVAHTAHAHTVTLAGGFQGGANHKATFGGAIGDTLVVLALLGKWYFQPSINQTLSAS